MIASMLMTLSRSCRINADEFESMCQNNDYNKLNIYLFFQINLNFLMNELNYLIVNVK